MLEDALEANGFQVAAAGAFVAEHSIARLFSGEMKSLSQMMELLPLMIVLASIVVVCVFGWPVSYSTSFMLSKRSRLFTISVILGVTGTFLIMATNLYIALIGAVCIIFFLFGFFLCFASGVPAFFDRRPPRKYRGQNLLTDCKARHNNQHDHCQYNGTKTGLIKSVANRYNV